MQTAAAQKQRTIQLQIDGNLKSAAKLKHKICNQIGLPDCDSAIFTQSGRSILTKDSFEAEKWHLSTIQVTMALRGGSRTSGVQFNQNSAPVSRSEALNKFMILMSSLKLSEIETDILADQLNDL